MPIRCARRIAATVPPAAYDSHIHFIRKSALPLDNQSQVLQATSSDATPEADVRPQGHCPQGPASKTTTGQFEYGKHAI